MVERMTRTPNFDQNSTVPLLTAEAAAPSGYRRLHRSRTDKRVFGVCGGIANHFDVDPNAVRLAVAALALLGGTAIPLYVLAAVILPEESAPGPETAAAVTNLSAIA